MPNRIIKAFRNYIADQKAFTYRNYRLFVVGQCFSLIGTWIQRLAMIWLSYQLTGSAFLLGLVAFCEQIPIFVLAPFAGVYADKWDKHKALIRIEILAMLQAVILGTLTLTHAVNIYHLIILSLCLGCINAFEVPIRQSFVVDMVDRKKEVLPNAIAMNSTIFNTARLIGPSVAGILISTVGEGWCFMANGFSYAIVTVSILCMHIAKFPKVQEETGKVLTRLKEGIVYIKSKHVMRTLLILLAIVSFSNASLRTLAPIFAQDVLHGNANTLGFLMTASGIGAITGAIFLTKNKSMGRLAKLVTYTGLILGLFMILFAISKSIYLSLFFIAVTGLAQMMHTASTNTLLQLHVDDDKRGRVMSFYTVCLQGTMPFGSLVAGTIASSLSAPWSMATMGAICLAATLIFRHDKHEDDPNSKQQANKGITAESGATSIAAEALKA